jgi:hypothetical protein
MNHAKSIAACSWNSQGLYLKALGFAVNAHSFSSNMFANVLYKMLFARLELALQRRVTFKGYRVYNSAKNRYFEV